MTWLSLDPQITSIIAIAAALFAICAEARRQIGRSQRRAHDLKVCADLLDQHRAAFEEFVSSPDAPTKLKSALIRFAEVTSDRDKAHGVVTAMCSGERKTQGEADETKAVYKAVDSLRALNPELAHAFDIAVSAAIGAMLYRWSETADLFRDYVTKAVIDSRKGNDLFARAARYGADKSAHDRGGPISLTDTGALPI